MDTISRRRVGWIGEAGGALGGQRERDDNPAAGHRTAAMGY